MGVHSYVLWTLQPIPQIAWHQFSFQRAMRANATSRLWSLDFIRRTMRVSPKLISWSIDNVIAVATPQPLYFGSGGSCRVDDFPAPATYDGSQTDWTFSWRVLLVNPDQPGKVVNIVDKSKPITYVAWAPSWCPRLLLVATNATITVWYQHQYLSNQYVCNARSEYGVPDTILCSWVDPKIKYNLHNANRDAALFSQKFLPQTFEPMYRDPSVSFAFVSLSSDGVFRWFYKKAKMVCAEHRLKYLNGTIGCAAVFFISFNTVRLAISTVKAPNVITTHDLRVDYVKGEFIIPSNPAELSLLATRLEVILPNQPMHYYQRPTDALNESLFTLMSSLFPDRSHQTMDTFGPVCILQMTFDEFDPNVLFLAVEANIQNAKAICLQKWAYIASQWSLIKSMEISRTLIDYPNTTEEVCTCSLQVSSSRVMFTMGQHIQIRDPDTLDLLYVHEATFPTTTRQANVTTKYANGSHSDNVTDELDAMKKELDAVPVSFAVSPNGTSMCTVYSNFMCEMVILTPLYLLSNPTSDKLAQLIANYFELALLRRFDWWDVMALLLTLHQVKETRDHQQCQRYPALYKDTVMCLMQDLDKCKDVNPNYALSYKPFVEQIKAAIFRSCTKGDVNFINCNVRLVLRYIADVLKAQFRSNWKNLSSVLQPDSMGNLEEVLNRITEAKLDRNDRDKASLFATIDIAKQITRYFLRAVSSFVADVAKRSIGIGGGTPTMADNISPVGPAGPGGYPSHFTTDPNAMPNNMPLSTQSAGSSGPQLFGALHAINSSTEVIDISEGDIVDLGDDAPPGTWLSSPGGKSTPQTPILPGVSPDGIFSPSNEITQFSNVEAHYNSTLSNGSNYSLFGDMSEITILPRTIEQYLAIADSKLDIAVSFIFEPDTVQLLKEVVVLSLILTKLSQPHTPVANLLEPVSVLTETYRESVEIRKKEFSMASAVEIVQHMAFQIKPLFETQPRATLRDRDMLIRSLDLLPPRIRILELNYFDKLSDQYVHRPETDSMPDDTYDVLTKTRIQLRDGLLQCMKCNRITAQLFRENAPVWLQKWIDMCPLCLGRWQYYYHSKRL